MRATQAHIHLDNLIYNISQIRRFLVPEVELCVPVKADGYGHGAVRTAIAAIRAGASFLSVASVPEAIELREAGIVLPILSLSLPTPEEIPSLIVHSITPLVFDREFIEDLASAAQAMHRSIPVHLKIDTGMGRIGCRCEESTELAELIVSHPSLFLEGVCTHLSSADSVDEADVTYTRWQIAQFTGAIEQIKAKGINPGIVHAANSGGVLLYPESHFNMVRPGIVVYGYFPDQEQNGKSRIKDYLAVVLGHNTDFKPVMEVRTQVVTLKKIKKGECISYGRTWTADDDTIVATLPIGYADGLPRRLSPGMMVCINDKLYPIVGRICMDQCMVNLGKNPQVTRWDSVIVFGPQKGCANAADLGALLETIPYEITCGINKRVPRLYTGV